MLNNEKTVTVRVPGTSANCGPGFDSMGMACTIYNDLTLTLLKEKELVIEVAGEGAGSIPVDESNIVWRSIKTLLSRAGCDRDFFGARISMVNRIPLSRGLGSSAAAIVCGIKAANVLLGNPFSRRQMLHIATEMEGHPDNVAPAIYGGFTITAMRRGLPECFAFMPRLPLKLVVAVPDFFLSTRAARQVLPSEVPMKDAVYNIGRAGMLVAALIKGNKGFLRTAVDDALHQPYRSKLIPGMYDVFRAAKQAGAYGVSMSGAGPCLIAFAVEEADRIGAAMKSEFANHGVSAEILHMDIAEKGAYVLRGEGVE